MTQEQTECSEKEEWRWCLVGNIVETHEYGEEHEIRKGTKHFPPGAKVYVNLVYGGMGHEFMLVIGKPRRQRGLIEVVIPSKYITNFRVQKVYSPALLKRMNNSEHEWWGVSEEVHEELIEIAQIWNERANP